MIQALGNRWEAAQVTASLFLERDILSSVSVLFLGSAMDLVRMIKRVHRALLVYRYLDVQEALLVWNLQRAARLMLFLRRKRTLQELSGVIHGGSAIRNRHSRDAME